MDVYFFNTIEGGELGIEHGVVEMDTTLRTAFYLAIMTGNDDDPTGDDTRLSWWGNSTESDPARQYRSKTMAVLRGTPITSATRNAISKAVLEDLQPFVSSGLVTDLSVEVSSLTLRSATIIIRCGQTEQTFDLPTGGTL